MALPLRAVVRLFAVLLAFAAFGTTSSWAQPSGPSGSLPEPNLFDVAWDELDDLLEDVHPVFVPEARTHAHAPIYHLDYVLRTPTQLDGRVEIRIVNRSPDDWSELWLHLHPNLLGGTFEVSRVRLDEAAAAPAFERDGALMAVPLPEPLSPGAATVLAMDVRLVLPTASQRNYSLLAYRDGVVSLAHAYPLLAVYRAGQGWDVDRTASHGDLVFAEASWFRARLRAPADFVLVASGAEEVASTPDPSVTDGRAGAGDDGREPPPGERGADGEETQGEETQGEERQGEEPGRDSDNVERGAEPTRTWEVRSGPVRDLYLSLGNYEVLSAAVGGTTVRSYHLEGGERAAGEALDHAVRALETFGARWTPYPYRTFDVVPLTTEALGVEFPGVIALATRLYEGRGDLVWVVVHEVAHQWFYGLVGNDQITDPWLDEAMAQDAVVLYARAGSGDVEGEEVRRQLAARWRGGDRDTRIGLPVTEYSQAEYGSVVYGRGPLVILELEERVGREAFATFVRGYAAAFRWGVASPRAFRSGLEAACGCSLEELFVEAVLPD